MDSFNSAGTVEGIETVTGATESTLAPADGATRAQCAAILMRYVEA